MAQPPPAPTSPVRGGNPSRAGSSGRSARFYLPALVIGLAMLGSIAFIVYVVAGVDEEQIPLLAMGFVVLGASFVAIGLWAIIAMWRAASRARVGRALGLAIIGGLAGLAAIGCFTVAALGALVWNS